MVTDGIVKSGKYFDSVSLMLVAKKLRELDGVIDSSVVMATDENKLILKAAGLLIPIFDTAESNDLLIAIKAMDDQMVSMAVTRANQFLDELGGSKGVGKSSQKFRPKSVQGAHEIMPEANLAMISVAGQFAFNEAIKSLEKGMNVMLFSDNVSIDDEIKLKKYAEEKDLIVMGPDCGSAIIGGVPLAFANSVSGGDIGIVAASGTGLQETSTLISNFGLGVSHAIGTGGRDIKQEIGGISFLSAMDLLDQDESTKVILLVAKPPHEDVLKKIGELAKKTDKPVVAVFLGASPETVEKYDMHFAATLEEAAICACRLSSGKNVAHQEVKTDAHLGDLARVIIKKINKSQKYVRALYSGGTFCGETQFIFQVEGVLNVYSNAPVADSLKLEDPMKSKMNMVLDLGEDVFTVGRPHPMIDFSLRNRRILDEAANVDVAVILLDLVIGYGANMNPLEEFVPVLQQAIKIAADDGRVLSIICFVVGTEKDPQDRKRLIASIQNEGVSVVYSNRQAAKLCSMIINRNSK